MSSVSSVVSYASIASAAFSAHSAFTNFSARVIFTILPVMIFILTLTGFSWYMYLMNDSQLLSVREKWFYAIVYIPSLWVLIDSTIGTFTNNAYLLNKYASLLYTCAYCEFVLMSYIIMVRSGFWNNGLGVMATISLVKAFFIGLSLLFTWQQCSTAIRYYDDSEEILSNLAEPKTIT